MIQLSTVLLRIGGFSFIAYSIINISGYAPYLLQADGYLPSDVIALFLRDAFFPLLFAYLLIQHTETVQSWLKIPESVEPLESPELEQIGLSILGMFLFFSSLSDLAYHFAELWRFQDAFGVNTSVESARIVLLNPEKYALMVATVVELIFALYLLVGSKGLVKVLEKLRH